LTKATSPDRRRIDDRAAALFQHLGNLVLHAQPDPAKINRDRPIKIVLGAGGRIRHAALDTGVVIGPVDPTIGFDGLFDHHFDLRGDRDVGGDATCRTARILDHLDSSFSTLGHVIGDHDLAAFLRNS
jgi:hypothetical protein